jgi:hypothetical protein
VFADLVQEIQRSIGYYTSLHRTTRFSRIVGVGNGFRLPGLQKFLQQNLSTPVVRVDAFNAMEPSEAISAPQFTENVLGFAVAYGLAVQGLGLTRIDTNLLPNEIASARRWKAKRPWFAVRARADYRTLDPSAPPSPEVQEVNRVINHYKRLVAEFNELSGQVSTEQHQITEMLDLNKYASLWPTVIEVVNQSLGRALPHQGRIAGSTAGLPANPAEHAYIVMSWLESDFLEVPVADATAVRELLDPRVLETRGSTSRTVVGGTTATETRRGIRVILSGRCPRNRSGTTQLLQAILRESEPLFRSMLPDYVEYVGASIVRTPPSLSAMPPAGTGGRPTRMPERGGTHGGGRFGGGAPGVYDGGLPGVYGGGTPGVYGGGSAPGMYTVGGAAPEGTPELRTDGATGQSPLDDTLFQIGWVLRFKDPSAMPMP